MLAASAISAITTAAHQKLILTLHQNAMSSSSHPRSLAPSRALLGPFSDAHCFLMDGAFTLNSGAKAMMEIQMEMFLMKTRAAANRAPQFPAS